MISPGAKPPLKTQKGRLLSCFREPSGGECPSLGLWARPHACKDIAPCSNSLPVCLHLATDLYPFINTINQQSREQMVFLDSLSPPRKLSKMRKGLWDSPIYNQLVRRTGNNLDFVTVTLSWRQSLEPLVCTQAVGAQVTTWACNWCVKWGGVLGALGPFTCGI